MGEVHLLKQASDQDTNDQYICEISSICQNLIQYVCDRSILNTVGDKEIFGVAIGSIHGNISFC